MEHYFELSPQKKKITFRFGEEVIAQSDAVLMLKEKGRALYDPVYYFPREDVNLSHFKLTSRVSTCPIKGKAENYDFINGEQEIPKAAWSYTDIVEGAEEIKGRIALNTSIFSVEMIPHTA